MVQAVNPAGYKLRDLLRTDKNGESLLVPYAPVRLDVLRSLGSGCVALREETSEGESGLISRNSGW